MSKQEKFTIRQIIAAAHWVALKGVEREKQESIMRLYEEKLQGFDTDDIKHAVIYCLAFFADVPTPEQIIEAINTRATHSIDPGQSFRH